MFLLSLQQQAQFNEDCPTLSFFCFPHPFLISFASHWVNLFRELYIASLLSFSAVRFVVFTDLLHFLIDFLTTRYLLVCARIITAQLWGWSRLGMGEGSQCCRPGAKRLYVSEYILFILLLHELAWGCLTIASWVLTDFFQLCTEVVCLGNGWRSDLLALNCYTVQEAEESRVWVYVSAWGCCVTLHTLISRR